jgi:hypothetical protein
LLGVVQALGLSKARAQNHTMEVAQGVHAAELESDNAKLRLKLEQAHQALAEADATWSTLSMDHEELERECAGLLTVINAEARKNSSPDRS